MIRNISGYFRELHQAGLPATQADSEGAVFGRPLTAEEQLLAASIAAKWEAMPFDDYELRVATAKAILVELRGMDVENCTAPQREKFTAAVGMLMGVVGADGHVL